MLLFLYGNSRIKSLLTIKYSQRLLYELPGNFRYYHSKMCYNCIVYEDDDDDDDNDDDDELFLWSG